MSRALILCSVCAFVGLAAVGCGQRQARVHRIPQTVEPGYAYTAVLMASHPMYPTLTRLELAASALSEDDTSSLAGLMSRRIEPLTLTEMLGPTADPAALAGRQRWWQKRYEAVAGLESELPKDLWAGLEWEREQAAKQVDEQMAEADATLSRRLARVRASRVRQMQETLNNTGLDLTGREADVLEAAEAERQRIWDAINEQVEAEREAGSAELAQLRVALEAEARARVAEARLAAEVVAAARAEEMGTSGQELRDEMAGEMGPGTGEAPAGASTSSEPTDANDRLALGRLEIEAAEQARREVIVRQGREILAARARLTTKLLRDTETWAVAAARRQGIDLRLLPGGERSGKDVTGSIAAELERGWPGERR